ncbi:hypothetical protein D2T29_00505 [Sinirhodobacter populi]|uniref:Uncharacterized protein n=1 Tax=Paenirhodobacter populi TaxID=2306993 RepID=A0A443KIA5_9RHOB|nr:hypothetical protein [Sinirhodobacter populi]RWR32512.1 hypothetical protein D2T31_00575 [Sinirhodobacter populi]RWR34992.1 hypothetical protein D2T29_00505 [Sinirhodobacter populi]
MCFVKTPKVSQVAASQIAATDSAEATQAADIEARLRKRRAGAAANILTSATGIPSTSALGGVAQ